MKKGFTLVELLVTLVIIALLGGIGIISYQSFFNIGKEKYYSTLESGILLAGNDYFLDHRDKLPNENNVEPISLNDLVQNKYIEPVKDSKGNICSVGFVYAYRSNNKYHYEVCLECEDGYKSSGKYCNGGYSSNIEITGKTATIDNYVVTNSYNETLYTNNENVLVTFKMNKDYFKPSRYVVIDTKNPGTILTSCNADNNASCYVTITQSGTYEVKAYDENNKLISSNQQFNVRIAKNGPRYAIKGEHRFEISKSDCSNNKKTKNVAFKIVKNNINEEYKSIKYCVKRLENTNECTKSSDYQSNNSLDINLSLGSGAYILRVIVSNFADEETIVEHDFDIMYTIDLKYEDGDSNGTFKVVKGQNYNYLSTKYSDISSLPTKKRSYGVDNLEIRWHLDGEEYQESKRITGTTTVTNECTYAISGLTSVPIDKPTTEYCANPTYNGGSQSLTKNMEHVTFLNKDQTNAGTYTVEAKIDSPYYIWKDDWDFENKPITCSMARANVNFPSCSSQTYTGSPITLFAAHSSGVGYTNSAISGTNAGSYSGNLTPDGNHKWTDTNGTGARSLSCSITRANVNFPSCSSQTYTGSPITLFAAHSSGVGYTNSAISGTNVNTYSGNLTPDGNHKWTDTNGTGARSLSCSITRANGYVNLKNSEGQLDHTGSTTFQVESHHGGSLSCKSSDKKIAKCSIENMTVTVTGVKEGNAIITVTSAATDNYNQASTNYSATVIHRYDWWLDSVGWGSATGCQTNCPYRCSKSWCCSPNALWPYSSCGSWNGTYGVGPNCYCGN